MPTASSSEQSVAPRASTSAPTTTTVTSQPPVRRGAVAENIQVFIRIRPLIERETNQTITQTSSHSLRTLDDRTIEVRTADQTIKCAYDAVFDPSYTQEQVYDRVRECTQSFLQGFNATLFAYGQTGSGKSFTMFGSESDLSRYRPGLQKSQAGIIPRAIKEIFEGVIPLGAEANAMVYCSFVQIYNEQIFDLLRDGHMERPLEIHEDRKNGIYVDGLSEYAVRSVNDCLALLQSGEQNRAVRSTHMNQVSSRSHSVFQLQLEQRRKETNGVIKSKFNLVDLAGSEKWNFASDMQHHHISEMTNINLSLHTLGRCIASLSSASSTSSTHVPYRDSKLTRLLQDSLGGNTKTKIIATLSPSFDCIDESISTLKFADRAKQVMVTVRVNEQREIDPAYVEKLEDELQRLRELVRLLQSGGKDPALPHEDDEDDERDEKQPGDPQLKRRLAQLMQENLELRARQEQQQKEMLDLRTRFVSGNPASNAGIAASGPPLSASEANLAQAKQQLETTLRQLKDASDRFFKFEIEEDELKSIHERLFKGQGGSAAMMLSPSPFSKPRPPSILKPSGTLPSPSPSSASAALPTDLLYRVRSRATSLPGRQTHSASTSGNQSSHQNANQGEWHSDTASNSKHTMDPEKELELSRKAIEKQQKLQNWLIEKEKRELMKLQQEQEYVDEQRRLVAERDAKFFKHAQATKKKLQVLATKQSGTPVD
ncbi:hypothetical protein Poli38472_005809 [Pythium oligandrum]|uniref:Kinesin-like protein n=1 Tax=Pythium oligandrum TaxID=41045 RepID=A0A8K1FMK3_PYTOL|nr:hypothetical protein Poli38472_005809 [Pythium oligandrum]|eukprot:TMW68341.1 hypothetical protein Poli38472_005809 [Pythium oligandrum]